MFWGVERGGVAYCLPRFNSFFLSLFLAIFFVALQLAESLLAYGLEKLLVKKAVDPRLQRGRQGGRGDGNGDVSMEDNFHGLDLEDEQQEHDATPWQFLKGAALELCYGGK